MFGGVMIVVTEGCGQHVTEPAGQQGPPLYVHSSPVKLLLVTFAMPGGVCTTTTPRVADAFDAEVAMIVSCQGLHGWLAFEPVAGAEYVAVVAVSLLSVPTGFPCPHPLCKLHVTLSFTARFTV
jgi:hypothetical protein